MRFSLAYWNRGRFICLSVPAFLLDVQTGRDGHGVLPVSVVMVFTSNRDGVCVCHGLPRSVSNQARRAWKAADH
jgi:hypothetical protein